MLKLYPLFVLMASATVLIPGPGVVMTLTNALRYGMQGAIGGILGIAAGALVVAGISATSLGILLATSALAFTAMKLIGAAYLIYLGIRLWRAPGLHFAAPAVEQASFLRRLVEGISLQLTNPKAIFFFLSVLPQFIETDGSHAGQFFILALTYSALVVVVHCLYGFCAARAKAWLVSGRGQKTINRSGAVTLVLFGMGLAGTSR